MLYMDSKKTFPWSSVAKLFAIISLWNLSFDPLNSIQIYNTGLFTGTQPEVSGVKYPHLARTGESQLDNL